MRHKLKCVQRLSTFAMPMLRMSNGCMNKQMDAWWMDEWMEEWTDEWMNEWMNEPTNEWMNEPTNEWTNAWTNFRLHSIHLSIVCNYGRAENSPMRSWWPSKKCSSARDKFRELESEIHPKTNTTSVQLRSDSRKSVCYNRNMLLPREIRSLWVLMKNLHFGNFAWIL